MATTSLRLGGFIFVFPIMLRRLSSEEIGIWYVFLAVGGLVALLDMGFMSTTTRVIGYAWAGAKKLEPLGLQSGQPLTQPNKELAFELVCTSLRFYQMLALSILGLLTFIGSPYIWNLSTGTNSQTTILFSWGIFTVGIFLATFGAIWPALLTGINKVRVSQQIQFFSILCGYILNILLLLKGFGLLAPVIGKLAEGLILRTAGRWIFLQFASFSQKPIPRWSSNIFRCLWPMAWRSGLVSIGTFLIINVNTLLVASLIDLKTTASYGLSMQVMNTLVAVSGVWLTVYLPTINQLRIRGSSYHIARVFTERHRLSLITYIGGAVIIYLLGSLVLSLIGANTPLLPKPLLAILLTIGLLEMNHGAHALLVLSRNNNPFVLPALISGATIVLFGYLLAPHHGIWGIVLTQGLVQAAFNNWYPVLIAARSVEMSPLSLFALLVGIESPKKHEFS